MFEKVRDKLRELIRTLDYVMTIHGEEEMENDGLSIFDIENAVLTGEIIERQQDSETAEPKYLVAGKTLDERSIDRRCNEDQLDGKARNNYGL